MATISTGNMGTGLGRQFAAAGHGTCSEAIARTDAFLLAVNWWDIDEVLPQLGDVGGKILIDCTNPYTDNTYSTPADLGGHSAGEVIQERLPGARLVKAWNHVYAQIVNSSPEFGGEPASMLIASDDAEAKEAVASLARDAGYDPVDAGPLWSAFNVEKVATVMITIAYVVGPGANQALKIVGR